MTRTKCSESFLRQLEGSEQRLCFIARFLELGRGIRVDHDPRAGLHERFALRHDHCADRDAEIEVAGEIQVADRTRVEPAARRLEFLDDLHRANLWRS